MPGKHYTCTTCLAAISTVRQCAVPKCGHEIGFCVGCGGDPKAIESMQAHHAEHAVIESPTERDRTQQLDDAEQEHRDPHGALSERRGDRAKERAEGDDQENGDWHDRESCTEPPDYLDDYLDGCTDDCHRPGPGSYHTAYCPNRVDAEPKVGPCEVCEGSGEIAVYEGTCTKCSPRCDLLRYERCRACQDEGLDLCVTELLRTARCQDCEGALAVDDLAEERMRCAACHAAWERCCAQADAP